MTKRLVIIDGKSVFYRGYYAMPNLSTADGTPTGGVYGFAALSLELIRQIQPDYVCVAWDKPKTNIRKRLEIYPEYKAGRKPAPPDFYAQIPILHELLDAFGWPLYEFDDYEADDIMATLDRQAEARGNIETYLITSDLDALQILDDNTFLYALKKGVSNIDKFDVAEFEARYSIRIDQFLDLKSLKGDASDNIPGVAGVGEKTATQLLQQFDTLDGIYEHLDDVKESVRKKLIAGKDSAYMSKRLAALMFDAPVALDLPAMDIARLDTAKLKAMLVKLEFRSLLRKLPDAMKDKDNAPTIPALDTNDIEEIEPGTAQAVLIMAPELVVWADGDNVWLSHERTKAACLTRVDAAKILVHVPMIGHDVKMFLKQLLADGITTLPKVQHDTAQGSFLLNPLRKSRRLEDLVGLESIDSPQSAVRAIWALYDEQRQAFEALPDLSRVAHEMDFPLIAILARMEHQGIRLDAGVLDAMNTKLTREIADIQAQVHDMVGYEFNVSSPMQLSEALFTKLQLPTVGIKKGRTGYSTGQKELDKLRGQHPIVELVERYRELAKLQNTYVTTLPQQADERGYVHTTFNQDVVATGRLSSTDPNLQNIPIRTALGRHIRDAFVPADGNMFVNADYSQFELRLAAVMAGEQSMIDDFNSDTDIHAKTAAEVYGVPLDDVTPAQRRRAKVVNFGVLYGMGQHGLAAAAHMSYAEAQHFIDEYYRMHPNLKAYMENTIQKAHDDGFVETLFGRRRWTPDVKSSNFAVRNAAERAAANMPIQGTEADLMKLAMIKVQQLLDRDYPKARQILQIHDSILVECPRTETKAIAALLVDAMEQVYPKLGVRLRVDVKIGAHWGDV
ncbi:MAG: DNA polymerase I [Candidatus Saccharimonas sp.]|nr:MAG: DNA polymerase I [Candidatus Saccharimonas sp.]